MQELTEDAVCYNFAKSKIKTAAEGIPACLLYASHT